jgi:hypothetical protein
MERRGFIDNKIPAANKNFGGTIAEQTLTQYINQHFGKTVPNSSDI